uniref:Nonstructural protein n=1 Tax=Chimpanzee parv4 TaxID=1511922 RepID=A0A3G2LVB4_9VIRU|nr:nonstructural protein [Chimpanzee parv4]
MDAPAWIAVLQIPTGFLTTSTNWRDWDGLRRPRNLLADDWPIQELRESVPIFDHAVNLGYCIFQQLFASHAVTLPCRVKPSMFLQLEPSSGEDKEVHYHLVVNQADMVGREFSNWLRTWKVFMAGYVVAPRWTLSWDIRKTRQGRLYQADMSFVKNYLLPKLPLNDCFYAWTNIDRFEAAVLSVRNRQLSGPQGAIALPFTDAAPPVPAAEGQPPTMAGKGTQRFMDLIDWLVENGIATEKRWLAINKHSYRSFLGSSGGVLQAKNALQIAKREMVLAHPLLGYLVKNAAPFEESNKVAQLFRINGYDPVDAAWYFAAWARGVWAKRRAIWLWGPASTGKTLLAAAIANLSPSYGCVNWTNQNFPFNDCHCQSLVWWEEGRMTENIVEVAKAVLGGAPVRLDVKNKGSEDYIPTCVILTSNGDLTVTVDGPVVSTQHQEALQTRITMFQFQRIVPEGLAPLPEEEVRSFFKLGEQELNIKGPPPEEFRVPRNFDKQPMASTSNLPKALCAPIEESQADWDSEDDWFPQPTQKKRRQIQETPPPSPSEVIELSSPSPVPDAPPNTPDSLGELSLTPTSISQIVSAPFPEETAERYGAGDIESFWSEHVFDADWATRLHICPPGGPRPYGLFWTYLWSREFWRFRQSIYRSEAHLVNRRFIWAWW